MHTLGIIHAPGEESLNPGGITSRSVHPYHCAIEQSILWWLNLGTQLSDDMVDFGGKFFRAKGAIFLSQWGSRPIGCRETSHAGSRQIPRALLNLPGF